MNKIIRIIFAILIFIGTYMFIFWEFISLMAYNRKYIPYLFSLIISFSMTWLFWEKSDKKNNVVGNYMLRGAFIIGGSLFLAGFILPVIFYPSSNLGPLLGIFFTGPIGFILGLLGGGVYGYMKLRKENTVKTKDNQ